MPKQHVPGLEECMRLMRKHDPLLQEEGFHALLPHAAEYVDKLITEFREEGDHGLRCWLLELLGEAKSPKVLPLFVECLKGYDESFWYWAVRGLRELDTNEARKALLEATSYTKGTGAETERFQEALEGGN